MSVAPEVSLDQPLFLLLSEMARVFGDHRMGMKDSAMMAVQHMILDNIFFCCSSQQLMSDSCHDNLCSVSLSKTTLILSECEDTHAKQIKKLICIWKEEKKNKIHL